MAGLTEDDEYFRGLADKMPALLLASRSDNTNKKYELYFKKFVEFMTKNNKCSLPARSNLVLLFIVHLLDNNFSYSVICSYIYSIKYMHGLWGYSDPTDNVHVRQLLSTSKRSVNKPKCKKDIVSPDHIKTLFELYSDSQDLFVIRDLTMIITCFSGFLRYDEMSNLKCNEIKFEPDYVKLVIAKGKTDQFRDGNEVLLAKIDSFACPYKALTKYVSALQIDLSSTNYLFRALFKTKHTSGLRRSVKKLSYTRTKEVLVSRLKEVTPTHLNLGLHTLRASGVSAAANSGVDERCFKRRGRYGALGIAPVTAPSASTALP